MQKGCECVAVTTISHRVSATAIQNQQTAERKRHLVTKQAWPDLNDEL